MITLKEKLAHDYREQRVLASRSDTSMINKKQADERARRISDQYKKLTGDNVNDFFSGHLK